MVDQVREFVTRRHKLREGSIGAAVVEDMDFTPVDGVHTVTDEEWEEMCRRLRDIPVFRREEKAAKLAREAEALEQRKLPRCSFCFEEASPTRLMVGDGTGLCICEPCVAMAVEVFAAKRAAGGDPAV
jgi:ClpX C4-type zinc finger